MNISFIIFLVLKIIYLTIIFIFKFKKFQKYWLTSIIFLIIISFNVYYKDQFFSLIASAIDSYAFIEIIYDEITRSLEKESKAYKFILLSNICSENNNNILYGFYGTMIAIGIGVFFFCIFSIFNNKLANALSNSIFDALKLFLTSVLLGYILNFLKKGIFFPRVIISLMACTFCGYLFVDTFGQAMKSSVTVHKSYQKKSKSNVIIEVNKNILIIKSTNYIARYKINKKTVIKGDQNKLMIKNPNSVVKYKLSEGKSKK